MAESLIAALERGPSRARGCAVKRTVDAVCHDSDSHRVLTDVVNVPGPDGTYRWSAPALSKLLKEKEGVDLAPSTIQRHRSGGCACSRIKES